MADKPVYTTLRVMGCCGVREVVSLSYQDTGHSVPFKTLVRKLYQDGAGHACGALVFTQARSNTRVGVFRYGKTFAEQIIEHKLGSVIESPSFTNPNSKNQVIVYVWVINPAALVKFISDEPVKPAKPRKPRVIPDWSK